MGVINTIIRLSALLLVTSLGIYLFKNKYIDDAEDFLFDREELHLAVVACGDRMPETLIMIKSAVLFSHRPIHAHIFADRDIKISIKLHLERYPLYPEKLRFSLYDIQFPVDRANEWIQLFKPCACQRLFIPYILKVDKLIYVDTDILFLRPVDDLWALFDEFNATQIAALSPEHEEAWMGWYNRFARHPFYPPLGLNSGVMLMDLGKLRAVEWKEKMVEYFTEYRWNTTWGDQDLINIFFHYHPEKLYVFACDWNYRGDHCMYGSTCKAVEERGASILHGSRQSFHNDEQPAFKAAYEAIREYEHGTDMALILEAMKRNFALIKSGYLKKCIEFPDHFTKQLAHQITLVKSAAEGPQNSERSDL